MPASRKNRENWHTRLDVRKMAEWRGLELRKVGHQFYLRSDRLGTLFHSHDINECKQWLREKGGGNLLTSNPTQYVDDRVRPVKYGRVIRA